MVKTTAVEKYGNVYNPAFTGMSYAGNVWNSSYYCPTLNSMGGGGRQPMVIVKSRYDKRKQSDYVGRTESEYITAE